LGNRHSPKEKPEILNQPHNVPYVALGTAMLWFGWFGFNGGSALQSNGVATLAAVNSQIAGSTALIGWLFFDFATGKKPGLVGACRCSCWFGNRNTSSRLHPTLGCFPDRYGGISCLLQLCHGALGFGH